MAVYKVIQDIESEDKIVGFLTLRTFVYALIAGALAYINIRFLLAGLLGPLRFVFVFILFWPMVLFAVLSAPLGREQSTEVWILAHVRFFLKPRLRIWNQSGLLELVTITAPKKTERQLTKNITQREVKSRLKALATTLDSRGWAVRNVAVNLSANPSYLDVVGSDSDRLAEGSNLPQIQTSTDVNESDDIMDEQNNPTAQHFEALMQQEDERRKKAVTEMITKQTSAQEEQDPEPPADYSFLDKVEQNTEHSDNEDTTGFVSHKIVTPGSDISEDESKLPKDPELASAEKEYLEREHKKAEAVHAKSAGFKPKSHSEKKGSKKTPPEKAPKTDTGVPQKNEQASMTKTTQNANLKELAQSGNDLSVASVQKLANRNTANIRQISANEVEIDLGH
jgi:hypothetical protein